MIRRVDELRHASLFCGIGGQSVGWSAGMPEHKGVVGRWRCLGGIDNDARAIRDFTRLTGVQGTVLDLFSREQFTAWHGYPPPAGWREATVDDVRRAFGGENPNAVLTSPPCKGNSGLLNPTAAATAKYQALNALSIRGITLTLEAFVDDPPEFVLLENVPRIAQRSRQLLDDITIVLRCYGYEVAETYHDCGVIGGLAQTRKRFLMVARHRAKVPPFIYEPPSLGLRAVGDVIGEMPMPDAPGVAMHRAPRLEWRTWVRLSLIPAGQDWRALQQLRVENGQLADYGIAPHTRWHGGVLGVRAWDTHTGTVTGESLPFNGAHAVADPRFEKPKFNDCYRVVRLDEASPTVTGGTAPGSGGLAVADPRCPASWGEYRQYGVLRFEDTSSTVTGEAAAGAGPFSVADPRCTTSHHGHGKYRVTGFDESAGTVIAESTTGVGAFSVADPRPAAWRDGREAFVTGGHYGVLRTDAPCGTVVGCAKHDTGAWSVADWRLPEPGDRPTTTPLIVSLDGTWHRPLTTLELAALQGFDWRDLAAAPLDGASDARHREGIGNAIPPRAAERMSTVVGRAILAARSGVTFELSAEPVWVRPIASALSIGGPA